MKYFYETLPPKERISKIIEEFLVPFLENERYKYSKSQRVFNRKNLFFDYRISFFNNRCNFGNTVVEFEIYLNIHSPQYKKWEQQFYGYKNENGGTYIDGGPALSIEGWDDIYMEAFWYSLVKTNNEVLVRKIEENLRKSAFRFFAKYESIDSAINEQLKKKSDGNFLRIFDFMLIKKDYQGAINFFENNNKWFEDELLNDDEESYFTQTVKTNYLHRKREYLKMITADDIS